MCVCVYALMHVHEGVFVFYVEASQFIVSVEEWMGSWGGRKEQLDGEGTKFCGWRYYSGTPPCTLCLGH